MKLALLSVLGLALLAACGGSDAPNAPAASVSVSTSHISASATASGAAPRQSVQIVIANPPATRLAVSVQSSGAGIAGTPITFDSGGRPLALGVDFQSPAILGPGVYTSALTISVCLDQQCASPLAGSPLVVTAQYTVT